MKKLLMFLNIICPILMLSGTAAAPDLQRSNEMKRLQPLIGKWITIGETAGDSTSERLKIRASDIYEWATGGAFIIHHAYGLIGNTQGGGVEIIGYDVKEKVYKSYFFDNKGNFNVGKLTCTNGVFLWGAQKIRCFGEFKPDGKMLVAHHQKLNGNGKWVPAMEVTLSKVE
ncbi:MAG: DUF1579 family protein [Mucilaginibacter sp.]